MSVSVTHNYDTNHDVGSSFIFMPFVSCTVVHEVVLGFSTTITLLSEQSGVECVCVCVLRVVPNFVVAYLEYVQHYSMCREKNQPIETTR